MTLLVLGASSQIGRFLLPRLREAGHAVLALSRRPQPAMLGVRWIEGGLPEAMPRDLPPLSGIVSYGPLLPFAQWLAQAPLRGLPRIVATSSMSAQTKRDSVVAAEREIARLLHEGEQTLADACAARGLAWMVLRPTIVYGAGLDRSLTPIARRAARLRLFPLPAGRGLRQPVHADDIALASIAALDPSAAGGVVVPIGGGERLTAAQMFARVRDSLPVATVPLPVPSVALHLAARLAPKLRGPLGRLDEDLVADNTALLRLLGVQPRPFRPDAGCWGPAR
ncbi:SDR family oxidoreductase [Dyella lutea]|uniref:NAD-dependent epimerase/dehydratase domain-containing protein n=1 Tax=Dyella lutea TaxID=2950441 RepID=A0ABT1F8E0_9GAMM|nr:NAD-dependent epimerase/dehydratase family protein [Dyella lutea]MCP1373629.1 hypothetical protein [Dyella lutea]